MAAKRMLTIFAHPDDETFTSGGTLAQLCRSGVEVYSLNLTRGEAGLRAGYENDPRPTGVIRELEMKRAGSIIGIREVRFLDYIDGTLAESDRQGLETAVEREIHDIKPDVILTFEPHGVSAHTDHQTVSAVVTRVVREIGSRVGYPKRLFYVCLPVSTTDTLDYTGMDGKPFKGVPDEAVHIWSDITSVFNIKADAMMEHRTQLADVQRIWKRDKNTLFMESFIPAWPDNAPAPKTFFDGL